MFKDAKIMFMYTETSLHCGSGSSLGVVDLPIQREKYTDYPVCQASGIKGAVREWFEISCQDNNKEKKIFFTFGPDFERGDGDAFAGAATFTDGRLLLFPIRSLNGVFAYATSRFALNRFKRDAQMAGIENIGWGIPSDVAVHQVLGAQNSGVGLKEQKKIVLEEYTYDFEENDEVTNIADWIAKNAIPNDKAYDYWQKKVKSDLVILPDNVFKDFVKQSTEVQARIRINNETKTVDKGALFYEEALPTDSLLYSVVMAHDPATDQNKRPDGLRDSKDVIKFLCSLDAKRLQLGGDITIGKGIVNIRFLNV